LDPSIIFSIPPFSGPSAAANLMVKLFWLAAPLSFWSDFYFFTTWSEFYFFTATFSKSGLELSVFLFWVEGLTTLECNNSSFSFSSGFVKSSSFFVLSCNSSSRISAFFFYSVVKALSSI
jgi:hypothetical protein